MSTDEAEGATALHIQQLKSHFKVVTDEQLAAKLSMSKQNIGNWRRRGAIPLKVRQDLYTSFGIVLGDEARVFIEPSREHIAFAVGLKAAAKYLKSLTRELTDEEWRSVGKALRTVIRGMQSALQSQRKLGKTPDDVLRDVMAEEERLGTVSRHLVDMLEEAGIPRHE